ncbi:MAG: PilZ domain-containing protein [Chloroflexi bacterium]|nr:PilZ domain-containing protein [Chloroflexota bacterium]
MRERRKEPRKTLMAYTQVFDLYGGYLIGYLADLHLHGCMVIGNKRIPENVELTIAIELPELPMIRVSRITLPVRVVWCEPDISPEFYDVGFEFKEVPEDQRKVIQAIIDNYEFRRDTPNYPINPSSAR